MAGMKAEMVKQALVRYIADSRLRPGDKLPSQTDLRLSLNVGSATISTAINALAEDNVLEIRDKVGAFIKKTGLDGHTGRNIAILINVANSTYNHILVNQLQQYLQNNNCHNYVFTCPADKDSKKLKNYPGLFRHLRQNNISGIIITCMLLDTEYAFLDREKIEFVSMLKANAPYSSCFIDFSRYIDDAFKYLAPMNISRPAVAARSYQENILISKPFIKHLKKINPGLDYRDYYLKTYSFDDSRSIVEELLSRPADKRPDALIFTGDVAMQSIVAWLVRLQKGIKDKYLPIAVALLNKQNPMMPILENIGIFELDICEQTKVAVESLLTGIRTQRPVKSHAITAKLVSLEEYCENSIAPDDIED